MPQKFQICDKAHSVKLGHQKGPFRAPFEKNVPFFTIVFTKKLKSGKAPFHEIGIGSYADGCGSLSEDLPDPLVQGAWAARIEERMELAWRRESGLVDNDVRVQ